MAGIDKCYVDNFKDYTDFKEWAEDKSFTTPRGVKVNIKNYIYDYWGEQDFTDNQSRPIFNTPTFVDNYLYHNCPLPFIQEWLKDRYCGEGYCKGYSEEITEELKIPDYEPCTKIKIIKKGYSQKPWKWFNKNYNTWRKGLWWVKVESINDEYAFYEYCETGDYWVLPNENDVRTGSTAYVKCSVRAIIRKILKKWKLPKGCKITISGRYVNDEWILITK